MDTLPDDVRRMVEHLVSSIRAQRRSLHGVTQLLNRVEEECSALHCITRSEIKANDSSPRLEPVDKSGAPDETSDLFDDPDSSDDDLDSATMNTGDGEFWYTKCPGARQAPDERLLEEGGDCPSGLNHARARTSPQPHHLGTAMPLRGYPAPDHHHPSSPPPEPRLIEVVPDSWENISDEHIHPQVALSQQPAEYMASSHTDIPIMHCENPSPQDGPDMGCPTVRGCIVRYPYVSPPYYGALFVGDGVSLPIPPQFGRDECILTHITLYLNQKRGKSRAKLVGSSWYLTPLLWDTPYLSPTAC